MWNVPIIIERCGGVESVAAAVGISGWAVMKWPKNGIPEKHWAALRDMAEIPIDGLHAANESARKATLAPAQPSEAAA